MSCFIFPDRTFLPWRLLAFGKTYQLRSYGITELTFRCYSLNKHHPDLHFEGWVTFCTDPFIFKTFLFKARWWHQAPEAGKMKAESKWKLCWDELHKHLCAGDRQRAMGHSISCSPVAPVCSSLCEGPKTNLCHLRYQSRHFSAAWKTWTLETAK